MKLVTCAGSTDETRDILAGSANETRDILAGSTG